MNPRHHDRKARAIDYVLHSSKSKKKDRICTPPPKPTSSPASIPEALGKRPQEPWIDGNHFLNRVSLRASESGACGLVHVPKNRRGGNKPETGWLPPRLCLQRRCYARKVKTEEMPNPILPVIAATTSMFPNPASSATTHPPSPLNPPFPIYTKHSQNHPYPS